jgi:hypothetical protein
VELEGQGKGLTWDTGKTYPAVSRMSISLFVARCETYDCTCGLQRV